MAIPKVNLRQKKGKKGTSYYIDFTFNGKRYRPSVGSNKKTALEICQKKQAELALGHFNLSTASNKVISLDELTKNFLSFKRNHIRTSSLKRY